MKRIPNILSVLRILLSLAMPSVIDFPPALAAMVLIVGLTDIADGFIARRYHCESVAGARLDTLGDWIFFGMAGILFLMKYKQIVDEHIWELLTVAGVRFFSLCTAKYRFGRFLSVHTIGNKISVFLIYLILLLIIFEKAVMGMMVKTVLMIALLSAVEELLIILVNKEIDLDQRCLFRRKTKAR